jgi:hypothetical protein
MPEDDLTGLDSGAALIWTCPFQPAKARSGLRKHRTAGLAALSVIRGDE